MLTHRLQILVGADQRRRLDGEARRRGVSVGAVVREAIDSQLGGATRAQRLGAVEEMASVASGPALPVEELDRIIDEQRERRRGRAAAGQDER